jgi:HEAT repeat protein
VTALTLESTLEDIAREDARIAAAALPELSGLAGDAREQFLVVWRALSIQRRRSLIDNLAALAEDNVELNFDAAFMIGLFDDDVQVRAQSVKALWEHDDEDIVPLLVSLLRDPEAIVRSEAALALGRFLLRGELAEAPSPGCDEIDEALRAVYEDTAEIPEVRGRALEALGVRGHEWVRDMIEDSYAGGDRRMQLSAVHAMGRSADPAWLPTIIDEMHNDDGEMRFEAAQAAGAIAEEDAVSELAGLTADEDEQVRDAAITALGQIGGPAARSVLHGVAAGSRDPQVLEAVSDALSEAEFLEDPLGITMHMEQSVAEDVDEEFDE